MHNDLQKSSCSSHYSDSSNKKSSNKFFNFFSKFRITPKLSSSIPLAQTFGQPNLPGKPGPVVGIYLEKSMRNELIGLVVASPRVVERFTLDGKLIQHISLPEPITCFLYGKIGGIGRVLICGTQGGKVFILRASNFENMLQLNTRISEEEDLYSPDLTLSGSLTFSRDGGSGNQGSTIHNNNSDNNNNINKQDSISSCSASFSSMNSNATNLCLQSSVEEIGKREKKRNSVTKNAAREKKNEENDLGTVSISAIAVKLTFVEFIHFVIAANCRGNVFIWEVPSAKLIKIFFFSFFPSRVCSFNGNFPSSSNCVFFEERNSINNVLPKDVDSSNATNVDSDEIGDDSFFLASNHSQNLKYNNEIKDDVINDVKVNLKESEMRDYIKNEHSCTLSSFSTAKETSTILSSTGFSTYNSASCINKISCSFSTDSNSHNEDRQGSSKTYAFYGNEECEEKEMQTKEERKREKVCSVNRRRRRTKDEDGHEDKEQNEQTVGENKENNIEKRKEDTEEIKEEDTEERKEEDTEERKEEDTEGIKEEDTEGIKEEDTEERKEEVEKKNIFIEKNNKTKKNYKKKKEAEYKEDYKAFHVSNDMTQLKQKGGSSDVLHNKDSYSCSNEEEKFEQEEKCKRDILFEESVQASSSSSLQSFGITCDNNNNFFKEIKLNPLDLKTSNIEPSLSSSQNCYYDCSNFNASPDCTRKIVPSSFCSSSSSFSSLLEINNKNKNKIKKENQEVKRKKDIKKEQKKKYEKEKRYFKYNNNKKQNSNPTIKKEEEPIQTTQKNLNVNETTHIKVLENTVTNKKVKKRIDKPNVNVTYVGCLLTINNLNQLWVGYGNGKLQIFDLHSFNLILSDVLSEYPLCAMQYSKFTETVVILSGNKMVFIWDLHTLTCLKKIPTIMLTCNIPLSYLYLLEAPDSWDTKTTILLCGCVDGSICVRRLERHMPNNEIICPLIRNYIRQEDPQVPISAISIDVWLNAAFIGDASGVVFTLPYVFQLLDPSLIGVYITDEQKPT